MALSETTVNKHNIKRAEVFAANGLCDLDIAFAHPKFDGYGESDCILCGKHHIKWLFSIKFDAPDALTALGKIATEITRTEEVTLLPVGSKCITDWLDAVPESAAKLEALKRWEKELKKAQAAKAAKAVFAKLEKLGFADQPAFEEAIHVTLGDIHNNKVKVTYYLKNKLYQYAQKLHWGRIKSAGTLQKVFDLLTEARTKVTEAIEAKKTLETPTAPPADPDNGSAPAQEVEAHDDLAHLSTEIRDLIVRARDLWQSGGVKKHLKGYQADALTDIAAKLKKYGKFVSDRQASYFDWLLKTAGQDEVAEEKVEITKSKPGDESFKSASGLVGARY